jgi:hypothetical protein
VIRRGGRPGLLIVIAALGLSMLGVPADGQDDLAIVDTHLHYSRDGWDAYPVPVVLGLLDRGGIRRAFVSSSPDEGTVMLYEAAPDRIVPVLRPYRERGELGSWHQDKSVPPYLEGRLRRPIYKGIGEFHLSGTDAGSAVVRQVVELARRHQLFLHCHCDPEAIDLLAGLASDLRVLWAHAGMSSEPDVVGPLLAKHRRLSVELALRSDVAPGGKLDPAWRALFSQYPDRFMVGTDTWIASRWPQVPDVQEAARTWLRQLPPDVARRIASENAERLAAGAP